MPLESPHARAGVISEYGDMESNNKVLSGRGLMIKHCYRPEAIVADAFSESFHTCCILRPLRSDHMADSLETNHLSHPDFQEEVESILVH